MRGRKGSDGGERITGPKRHRLVDAPGRIFTVVVPAADVQDDRGLKPVSRWSLALTPARRADKKSAPRGYRSRRPRK